jgi:hypothetical protein
VKAAQIVEIESHSSQGTFYKVDLANGRCSCPGWINNSAKCRKRVQVGACAGRPICKHMEDAGYTDGHERALQLNWKNLPDVDALPPLKTEKRKRALQL